MIREIRLFVKFTFSELIVCPEGAMDYLAKAKEKRRPGFVYIIILSPVSGDANLLRSFL